jgi:hypothetical protein
MPAYANASDFVSNGGRERADSEFSDPDASWGHHSAVSTRKGGGFYGYKLDMAVCTATDLPLAWNVRTARDNESIHALPLLDTTIARGFAVETAALDKGYDVGPIYDGCEARGVRPIIPLRQTTAVARGDHKPPTCEHGEWRFAGSDSSAARASGAARPANASPPPSGSRRAVCTRSSRARRHASRVSLPSPRRR